MGKNRLFVDHKLCFGCFACVIACDQQNGRPAGGLHWVRVAIKGPMMVGEKLKMDFMPKVCRHCAKPLCVSACPRNAIDKREDGIVCISDERCDGCLACLQACPFDALQFNAATGKVEKCNLCLERLRQGSQPACVQTCQAGAIRLNDSTSPRGEQSG